MLAYAMLKRTRFSSIGWAILSNCSCPFKLFSCAFFFYELLQLFMIYAFSKRDLKQLKTENTHKNMTIIILKKEKKTTESNYMQERQLSGYLGWVRLCIWSLARWSAHPQFYMHRGSQEELEVWCSMSTVKDLVFQV